MIRPPDFLLASLAAFAAGAVNALAGGGTLITFPVLTALGLPAVTANITSTVSLAPGHLGATFAQMKDLAGQRARVRMFVPAGILGGLLGGLLLVRTGEKEFRAAVPFLILLASLLLAVQEPVRAWLQRKTGQGTPAGSSPAAAGPALSLPPAWSLVPVALAGIYGGYFGAGLSVIILAVLGLVIDDSLTRLNALKQTISFSTNTAAAIFFLFSGHVVWFLAAVMAGSAILGGALGGSLAGRVRPVALRWIVVVIGVAVAILYLVHS